MNLDSAGVINIHSSVYILEAHISIYYGIYPCQQKSEFMFQDIQGTACMSQLIMNDRDIFQ